MNWRERMHKRRQRPPWWPEDEQWPPRGGPFRTGRRHFPAGFFLRVGCLATLVFTLIFAILALVFWLIAQSVGLVTIQPQRFLVIVPLAGATLLVMAGGVAWMVRSLRASLLPLNDLLVAAEKIADGDFTARVPERGPRDMREAARTFNVMAARLEADSAQRRDLLADVTHELRTPLTVIRGNLEGMIDGVYPADEAHLSLILDETGRISRLVDELRTLALAESGALIFKKEPTDLTLLARETAAEFRTYAEEAGVSIVVEEEENIPRVQADPAYIHTALANLVTNALRYSPEGAQITIRVENAPAEGGDRKVAISVADTGSGIAPDELPKIFDRFHRSSDSGGMGLGLAIVKSVVEVHGGTITAESTVGVGTVMRMVLPVFG